jgi:polysaccharide biosynthesis/export protein
MAVRRLFFFFLAMVMGLSSSIAPVWGAAADAPYRIGAGDVLNIAVWKDDSLTRQVMVLPDGTFSFPLIGRVQAKGRSLDELKQQMVQRLAKYVPDPIISMEVMRPNSLMVYVIGKVNRPGQFTLVDNINVLQALSLAGGLNAFANSSHVRIFRKQGAATRIFEFDYDAVSRGREMKTNIQLERGDVIVVP